MKYLVPCSSCGAKTPVEIGQAGQTVACSCGRPLEVPSVRALRQLEPVAEEKVAAAAWNRRKGVVFLGSAILAIAVLAAAVLLFLRPSVDAANLPPVNVDAKAVQQEVSSIPTDEGFIRFVLMEPWPPTSFADRLEKGQVPIHLFASAELLKRFEGPGQQFLAAKEALQAAQKNANRNMQLAEILSTRRRFGEWLTIVAALGGIGLLIAGSVLFIGDGQMREPARRRPGGGTKQQQTADRK
jgi:hypothetical protein